MRWTLNMKAITFQVSSAEVYMSLKIIPIHFRIFCCFIHLNSESVPYFLIPLEGSPLQFFVDAVNSGVVTAYGPGLSYGMVNKAATFTVVTKNAGEGITSHRYSNSHCLKVDYNNSVNYCFLKTAEN